MSRSRKWWEVATIFTIMLLIASMDAGAENTPKNLRAWHTDGQTFLVWEHSDQGPPPSERYNIFSSTQRINSIDNAELIGIVSANNGINHRLRGYPPTAEARWWLPKGFGGNYRVKENEAYFAVTPHEAKLRYYAVTPSEGRAVFLGDNSMLNPVSETTDPVTCTIQYQDDVVTIYGHWIDGRLDPESGRPGYPVMGNEYSNGLGFNFAVWIPETGLPSYPLPIILWLHGAGQSLVQEEVVRYANVLVPDGLFVTLDDPLPFGSLPSYDGVTFWFGYANEFNRFYSVSFPTDEATVIDYTARRVWWTTEWLLDNYLIDPRRISLAGHSMGGVGAILHSQLRPDLFAAVLAYVPPLVLREAEGEDRFFNIFGTIDQNLPTNLEGEPGIWDFLDLGWRLRQPHTDWPYTLIVSGTNDSMAPWDVNRDVYIDLDDAQTGYSLYWDEREHHDWSGAHFDPSAHLSPSYLTRFRKDASFPSFFNTDLDPGEPGRQPDPGNGDPEDGDPWGTWGGYFEWDSDDIIDTAERWECTIWVTSQSHFDSDIPESDTLLTDVTLRNLQYFCPRNQLVRHDYRRYFWELVDMADGSVFREGTIQPGPDGTLVIKNLRFSKDPRRLVIRNHSRNDRIQW